MGEIIVMQRGERPPRAPRAGGRMTPITGKVMRETFRAPVSRPGDGDTRPELWQAGSVDGLWTYERLDDTSTPWRVMYVPTGQTVDGYGTISAARRATAGGLRDELRREAMRGALTGTTVAGVPLDQLGRINAHRWLSVFLREQLVDSGEPFDQNAGVCACGGSLIELDLGRGAVRLAHIDVCAACAAPGNPGDLIGCSHVVCLHPRAN
jgi:hypothetical protein